ncbi:MAG: IS200/IS605 family element transposase accessory protein TnpB [Moorea sp. SIO1G6]|uniref:RNA-guided endonuclease InsQ/TnpB family protein n=1 Tax=Moorena sp. SIO1G6 TaxID=2607840 RepID=UPI0013C1D6F6|nr:transposase [Moorena sp. SIO1G6]NET67139.1 IS200/IS605 family element transposase accessory protein TnpB [Moorena sp. SIO1G6]
MAKKKLKVGVQQILLHPDKETEAILNYLCEQSGKLYNMGVYFSRQVFFKTGKLLTGKFDLIYEKSVGKTIVAKSLPSTPAQQTLMSVAEALKSYKKLRESWFKGGLKSRPKPPGYLKGKKMFKVSYPNSGGQKPKRHEDLITFSLGLNVKRWFGIKNFSLSFPSNLEDIKIKEWTILPKNGAFYLEVSYEIPESVQVKDKSKEALSIDLGTSSNLAACVDTLGNSFLIDCRAMKSFNQYWNKQVSTRKKGRAKDYWDNWLDRVTRKRNHRMRDGINKAAKIIINHCLEYSIGTIVLGWNEGFKQCSNMGRINNQQFVQIPLGKLKDRLSQLCSLHGIHLELTEEAYTSKASYLDGDSLPAYGEKPSGWKASGKRVKRGLYKTSNKSIVNADLNGSANILRKVARKLGIDLSRLSRRCLTTVAKIRLWTLPKFILSAESPRL